MQTPFEQHNHSNCIATALAVSHQLCNERGVKLTTIRQRVLELVWQNHQPIGAYDLLAILTKEGFNSAPPTVYRALEFLQEQGLIHKLVSINAYIGCSHPEHPHEGHFFICSSCEKVVEIDTSALQQALLTSALAQGFAIQKQTIEATGLCSPCQNNPQK